MSYLLNNNVNVQNNNTVVSTTNPFPVTAVSIYNSGGNLDTKTDGFGRLRISEPHTLFDSSFRYEDDVRNWNSELTGSGEATFITNKSCVSMNVTTASGDKVVRETKKVFKYQPGKSLLTFNSFVMAQPKTNLRQRVGYFNANDGHFLQANNTTISLVERSSVSGSVVDVAVDQSNWNVDKMDGTGPSGLTVNVANSQIFWTDTEWLGVGSVRAGFVVDGQFVVSHIFHHANKTTDVYMRTATLPVRLELENLGATSGASQLKHICNSVMSEAGYTPSVATRAVSTPLTGINLSQAAFTPVIAIRLKSGREDAVVLPDFITAYGLQNTPFIYRLSMDETVTGGSWTSIDASSSVEYNIAATGFSGGQILQEGIFGGGTIGAPLSLSLRETNSSHQLRRRLDGTRETFVLSVLATTNNDDVVASLTWQEF